MVIIPAHVASLRELRLTCRSLFDRPDSINSQVIGHAVDRKIAQRDPELFELCIARGFIEKRIAAAPGDDVPFVEVEVLVLTAKAFSLLAAYTEQPAASTKA